MGLRSFNGLKYAAVNDSGLDDGDDECHLLLDLATSARIGSIATVVHVMNNDNSNTSSNNREHKNDRLDLGGYTTF